MALSTMEVTDGVAVVGIVLTAAGGGGGGSAGRVVVLVLKRPRLFSGWVGVVVVDAVVGVVADGTAPALPCCCSRRGVPPRGWLRVLLSACGCLLSGVRTFGQRCRRIIHD